MLRACLIALAAVVVSGCTTQLPADASCHDKWETYSNDRMHGAMLGGLLGGSMSGNKPDC